MKIVTAAQMAALEAASERHGVGTDALMENAGLVVARAARHDLGGAAGARVLVLVGPGNNGADGLVAARHLRRWGAEVTAYLVTRRPDTDPKMDLALEYGVGVLRSASDPGLAQLERLLAGSRLVIDAVLGTGRARPLEGAVRDV
ncbi:MAG: NAD(P)H-hydrate epimerase, partial [Dehalococcoidia bacterium]|nr:NAD(P)H-hydrate epimerase [Dehalococcoidia bacterium]